MRTVPATLRCGHDVVTVTRAWPARDAAGLVVEGRDQDGRVRAGHLTLDGVARLLPYGADPRLPGLRHLVPGAGALPPYAEPGQVSHRPGSRVGEPAPRAEVVVHRAGRRAVVRGPGVYLKVLRRGAAQDVLSSSGAGARLALRAGFLTTDLQCAEAVPHTVVSAVLPGRPVHELSGDPAWPQLWRAWARAWIALQSQDVEVPLTRHTDRHEAAVVRGWACRTAAVGVLPPPWSARADAVADRLEGQPAPGLVPAHRDLHDKQLLWDGRRLGVLDLDTIALAAPELDPVNLAVHADLRRAQGRWSTGAAQAVIEAAAQVLDEAPGGGPGRRERVRAAELATVVRLACVYACRPQWRELVLDWAERRWLTPELG